MKIKGLQKLTLIDYPGKLACTIFLFGCNFRCGFCHNPELVLNKLGGNISEQEVLDFLEKRKKYLEGICITGGEPLLTLEKNFLEKIKSLGYKIKLDTNGSFPEKLEEFVSEGLIDFVSMDIKSSKENYLKVSNSKIEIEKIEKSIKLISGLKDYEFRTTILEEIHTTEEMEKIGKWLNELIGKRPKKYFLQGFKNNGKFIDQKYQNKIDVTEVFLERLKQKIECYFEEVGIRV